MTRAVVRRHDAVLAAEIVGCQLRQYLGVDIVVTEGGLVSFATWALQPRP